MAQEGIATLPMQPMPEESQGIGAFQQEAAPEGMTPISEFDRYEAIITALEQQMPGLQQKIQQILQEANLTPEQVEGLSQVVQFLEQNKDNYPAALQSLIADGLVEEGDLPPQYDEQTMIILKMVIYAYQMQQSQPEPVPFAKGGLAQAAEALRRKGRGGDTILAHINPQEAALLKRMGGSGTINPDTGLPEFLFKGVTNAVKGAVKGVTGAVGGAVKSVVGAANKVFGPQLTQVALTVGGFMLGGPAGAALGAGLGTYGSGGSLKDALISSAAAFAGAHFAPTYGWKAGALIGAGATLARGGSFKDALKSAAIGAGTTALMQGLSPSGTPAEVTDASRLGTIDANGNFIPSSTTVATPGSVSGINPTGTGTSVLTPGAVSAASPTTTSGFGISAGPAPGAFSAPTTSSGLGSLNFQAPTNYLAGVPTASSAGISSLGGAASSTAPMTLSQIGNNIMQGNFGQAGSNALTWMGQNKGTTAMLGLGAMGAMGGFTPEQPQAPGIIDRGVTGETLMAQNPSRYIVQGMPGVRYTDTGAIDYTGTGTPFQPNPAFQQSATFSSPAYGAGNAPVYPVYTPPMNAAAPVAGNPVLQPYNTAAMYNFLPSNQPRFMNKGGISQVYPRRTGQISGPGTETSDDIPAMLSDGEFVITAKAVRGIGNGSRREGAKKLYRMMHAMEKKAGGSV